MYIFGEFTKFNFESNNHKDLFKKANSLSSAFAATSIDKILDTLAKVGHLWSKNGKYYNEAIISLEEELSFSKEMIEFSLDIIPFLLDRVELKKRLQSEFQNIKALDRPTHINGQNIMYSPLGVLLHITAGNVFLGCIDSLIMGFLTKNISLIKLSSKNQSFPILFAKSILEADTDKVIADKFSFLSWKGGNLEIENSMKSSASAIIAWGGEEMVSNYKENLPYGTKLFDFGPKISIGVIDKDALEKPNFYKNLVKDVCLWDQSACANMQNLFVDSSIDKNELILKLAKEFENFSLKRGKLMEDEEVDILKEYELARYSSFETKVNFFKGEDFLIYFENNKILRPSPLNRTLIIKEYHSFEELTEMLSHFTPYLQTCALDTKKNNEVIINLSRIGVKRFTKIGSMLEGKVGAPHDGSFNLVNLTNIISIESDIADHSFLNILASETPFYKDKMRDNFLELPLLSSSDLLENPISTSDMFLTTRSESGTIFSSGGTSGAPKFVFYTKEEFDYTCFLLSESYRRLGLHSNIKVANLFVAGNMWSSFLAIYKALENLDITQLPIGGQANTEDIVNYINTFQPEYLFGIPSLLVELSYELKKYNLSIKGIFYAGERLSLSQKKTLIQNIGCDEFHSAGYASVDVGPIGYQDETCEEDEHILFDGLKLEIINDEAVISSSIRKVMPVLRYKTGDKVKLIDHKNQVRFKLLGRVDKLIFIWGARISIDQLMSIFFQFFGKNIEFQLVITDTNGHDELEIRLENTDKIEGLLEMIWQSVDDLKQTLSLNKFSLYTKITNTKFELNKRTGKRIEFLDKRF